MWFGCHRDGQNGKSFDGIYQMHLSENVDSLIGCINSVWATVERGKKTRRANTLESIVGTYGQWVSVICRCALCTRFSKIKFAYCKQVINNKEKMPTKYHEWPKTRKWNDKIYLSPFCITKQYSIKLIPECIAKTCFQYSTSSGSGSGRRFNKQPINVLSSMSEMITFCIWVFCMTIEFDIIGIVLCVVECCWMFPKLGNFGSIHLYRISASWAEMKRLFASALHKLNPIHC